MWTQVSSIKRTVFCFWLANSVRGALGESSRASSLPKSEKATPEAGHQKSACGPLSCPLRSGALDKGKQQELEVGHICTPSVSQDESGGGPPQDRGLPWGTIGIFFSLVCLWSTNCECLGASAACRQAKSTKRTNGNHALPQTPRVRDTDACEAYGPNSGVELGIST